MTKHVSQGVATHEVRKLSTIKDVADRAGVSVATVSAVINSSRPVSDRLRKRVLSAIEELKYHPNHFARALSTKKSLTIGGLVPSIANPFFPQILKSAEEVAFEHSYSVVICNTDGNVEKVRRYQQMLLEHRVAGVFLTLTWDLARPEVIRPFTDANIPVVGLAGARIVDGIDIITVDDEWGSCEITSVLLRLGHRRLAFIGVEESESTRHRLQGFHMACEVAGVEVCDRLVRLGSRFDENEGYVLTKSLLAEKEEFTALVAYNDVMAQGALSALAEAQIRVPQEVSVVGFDDTLSSFTQPKLSSVEIPKDRMGRLAAEMLIKRINGSKEKPQRIMIRPEPIIRQSIAPPMSLHARFQQATTFHG